MKRMKEEMCCGMCGQIRPAYQVEDVNHALLGCENCLIIKREGVIQL